MTDTVHILRCALCKKPFSYIPSADDKCAPGSPNQICDECGERLHADAEREAAYDYYMPWRILRVHGLGRATFTSNDPLITP
jgi:hypothetical protein